MKNPKFAAAVEAENQRIWQQAMQELCERRAKERAKLKELNKELQQKINSKKAKLSKLGAQLKKVESKLKKYKTDPNGFLLLKKQLNAIQAALVAIMKKPPYDASHKGLAKQIQQLKAYADNIIHRIVDLDAIANDIQPKNMAEYIKKRRMTLGNDLNKGVKNETYQEGVVGADIEMEYGGLKRAPVNELEFVSGDLSPYTNSELSDSQSTTGRLTLDVLGPSGSEGAIWRILNSIAKQKMNGKQHARFRKLYGPRKSKNVDVLNLLNGSIKEIDFEGIKLTQAELLNKLAEQFMVSLKIHLKKAEIVPLDLSSCPNVLRTVIEKKIKKQISKEDQKRIHWYDSKEKHKMPKKN